MSRRARSDNNKEQAPIRTAAPNATDSLGFIAELAGGVSEWPQVRSCQREGRQQERHDEFFGLLQAGCVVIAFLTAIC